MLLLLSSGRAKLEGPEETLGAEAMQEKDSMGHIKWGVCFVFIKENSVKSPKC